MNTYKNKKPLAILMAVYNGEPYICEQIDSIIAQTNQDWTLYIRDDASTDTTVQIIKEYIVRYAGKVVLIDEGGENLGCRGNFFRLLEAVDSEYYMFSDADDVWYPETIERCYSEICKLNDGICNRPIVVHTNWSVTDVALNILIKDFWKETKFCPEKFYSYNLIAIANPVGGSQMTFNHYLKTLLFPLADNTLMHDRWIPMVAAANHGVFKPIKEPLRLYRMHGNNVYGIKLEKTKGVFKRIHDFIYLNKFVADKLRVAGYGGGMKYAFYKIIYTLKSRL